MSMDSILEDTARRVHFDALKGNKSADVLIIGGITKNTTAKITLQHGLIYDKMIRRFGEDKARLYVKAQSNAIKEYARLCQNIDCDYETRDNYVYSLLTKR